MSEHTVTTTLSIVLRFTNPFSIVKKDKLYSLSSGAASPLNIEIDVLQAGLKGQREKEKLIHERLQIASSVDKIARDVYITYNYLGINNVDEGRALMQQKNGWR